MIIVKTGRDDIIKRHNEKYKKHTSQERLEQLKRIAGFLYTKEPVDLDNIKREAILKQ